ncbi:helix-turn-helix domain-containing protein [Nocardia beijingensis]|uniref:helix-turn-helix domain-containing protein n=2 Tax=Nocardia beijingensis TaxID=95162 RepID=UPI0018933FFC|nr:helix-turn-helix transcriptional regulator [Nocardia beijingensis]MBF6078865.1 helix-turn-helix domain-containing protein [Nocardia beijingensis]
MEGGTISRTGNSDDLGREGLSEDETGSTLPRRQLGRHLRDAREALGMTLIESAKLMEWGKSTLQRLEKGQTEKIRSHDIRLLCEQYQLGDERTRDLLALAEQTAVKSWWHEYGSLITPGFDVYMGLESSARQLTFFQPSVVPGLLQTTDYAMALDKIYFPNEPAEEIDKRVQLRLRRQGFILRRRRPADIVVILHESVLRTVIGSRKVMAAQLRHLADLGTHPHIKICVLPFWAGLPVGMSTGPFLILDFDVDKKGKPDEPSVVYVESFTGGIFLERLADLSRYREAHRVIQHAALDVQPSRDLLREVAKEHERAR